MTKRHQKHLFCVGANHNSAAIDFREKLFLSVEQLTTSLPQIRDELNLTEIMALSTCNRLELYGVSDQPVNGEAVFLALQKQKADFDDRLKPQVHASLYIHHHREAAEHAFQVASGLDSLVLGETQITGQFKESMQHAKTVGTIGPILSRMCQAALSESKKVRTFTEIGRKPISISHAAIQLAMKVAGDIKNHKMMIIGAGDMASVAARYAVKCDLESLSIVNRTVSKAQTLVEELKFGKALSLDDLAESLPVCDIVLSSTSSSEFILNVENIKRALRGRSNRPLYLIDIALPRNIDPKCAELDGVYLFDIDDLKQIVGEHKEARRLAALKARGMIVESAHNFIVWLETLSLKPALSGFRAYLDDLVAREADRTLNKEIFRNLDQGQLEAINALVQSIAGKISSDASSRVKTPPEGFFGEQLATALKVLFPAPKANGED
ncbi:MAG: glutamyl-tRNA reductase [Oligoflexales bacterium]